MAREMKDSGVEWIGEIPAEWEVKRVSTCFLECTVKNEDNQRTNALQFKMGKIIRKRIRTTSNNEDEDYSAYKLVAPGTIIINGLNLEFDFISQRVGIVEENGIITSAYIAISPLKSVFPQYMCYLNHMIIVKPFTVWGVG